MEVVYQDKRVLVCCKPIGVVSVDEEGGVPALLREQLGEPQGCVRTVHRLDRTVGGLMVLARSRAAASILSAQVQGREFAKDYFAVLHGVPEHPEDTLRDLLARDKKERRTYVTDTPGRDAREAVLDYTLLASAEGLSLVRILLHTGRTHQIRAQFSSRGLPLWGDRKYGAPEETVTPALWSCRLAFRHPEDSRPMEFFLRPPEVYPWNLFPDPVYKPSPRRQEPLSGGND